MKILRTLAAAALFALGMLVPVSCEDSKSYAELLTEQDHYVNNYLADQRVELDIPADTVFIYGPNAPYYRIDEDGTLYMQVIKPGTKGNMVSNDEQIYFRYTRYSLAAYKDGRLPSGSGNNISLSPAWFRYNNYNLLSSYNWGVGVQRPLAFLPVDCEVNLVVKAQMGFTQESSDVLPYLFRLTYERRQ